MSRSNEKRHGLRNPERPDLGRGAVDERVVGRHGVGLAVGDGGVDPQHLAEQLGRVGRPPLGVAARPAVTHTDVE